MDERFSLQGGLVYLSAIKVYSDSVISDSSCLTRCLSEISKIKDKVSSLRSGVDSRIAARRGIGERLSNSYNNFLQLEKELRTLHVFIQNSMDQYNGVEKYINDQALVMALADAKSASTGGGLFGWANNLLSDTMEGVEEMAESAWDSTASFVEYGWDFTETAWDVSVDSISDAWQNAESIAGTAWNYTSDYLESTWDQTTEVLEAAWDANADYFRSIDWGAMVGPALNIVDGAFEIGAGLTLIGISGAAEIFTAGAATPLAIAGMVGSAYLLTDGFNKIVSGTVAIGDDIVQPTVDNMPDIPNYIEELHKMVFGDQWGGYIYDTEQFAFAVFSIEKAIKELTTAAVSAPIRDLISGIAKNPKEILERLMDFKQILEYNMKHVEPNF